MSRIEKIILAAAVAFSWAFGFFVSYLFNNVANVWSAFWLASAGILIWLIPFVFLVLFSKKAIFSIGAFTLGVLVFLALRSNIYIALGLFLLVIGFANWFFQVRFVKKTSIGFSVRYFLRGIYLFAFSISVFGAILSFYSPYVKQAVLEPKIPEKIFDSVYDPLSEVILNQVNSQFNNFIPNQEFPDNSQLLQKIPGAGSINDRLPNGAIPDSAPKEISDAPLRAPTADELKPQFYQSINESVANLAGKYQNYIPFAFAASVFLLLQTIFIPLKYLLLLIIFILVKMFIKVGWFKKEKKQVEIEEIKI